MVILALSVIATGSDFRFFREDEIYNGIPTKTLSTPKTLGYIVTINRNATVKKCRVLKKASYYWSDELPGVWKPLMETPNDRLFKIRATKKNVSLQVSLNPLLRNPDSNISAALYLISITLILHN